MSTMTEQEMLRRISACLNACRGIETAVLEDHSLGVITAAHSQRLHDAEKQQEAEPVAWASERALKRLSDNQMAAVMGSEHDGVQIPLYLHPPKPAAQPHWTDSHIKHESESGSWYAYDEVGLTYGTYETKDEARDALVIYEATELLPAAQPAYIDADELSNFIRKIDGNHSMGAGALAENIVEWLEKQAAQPTTMASRIADALESANWSGVTSGNQCLILSAIDHLRAAQQQVPDQFSSTDSLTDESGSLRVKQGTVLVDSTGVRWIVLPSDDSYHLADSVMKIGKNEGPKHVCRMNFPVVVSQDDNY